MEWINSQKRTLKSLVALIGCIGCLKAAPVADTSPEFIFHIVKRGESISLISIDTYGFWSAQLGDALKKLNPKPSKPLKQIRRICGNSGIKPAIITSSLSWENHDHEG